MSRPRLRELGIIIGKIPTGTYNAITDVPGVQVGHVTILHDAPRIARTGVTMVVPFSQTYPIEDRPPLALGSCFFAASCTRGLRLVPALATPQAL